MVGSQSIAAIYGVNELDKVPFLSFDEKLSTEAGSDALISDLPAFENIKEEALKDEFITILQQINKRQFQEARDRVQQVIKRRPDLALAYILKAKIDLSEKDRSSALTSLNKALEIDSKNQAAMLGIASIYLNEGKSKNAKDLVQQAIAVDKKTVAPYLMMAEMANRENNLTEVERILVNGLESVKGQIADEATIISSLAQLYKYQRQPRKVLALVQEINGRYPNHSVALSLLVGAQLLNNQAEEAGQTLRLLIARNDQDILHRMMLANILVNQPDKVEEVLVLLEKVSSIAPDNLQILVQKANLFIRVKHFDEAMNVAQQVAALAPQTRLGKAIEGDVYQAQNKLDQAYEAYKDAYRIQASPKLLGLMVDILTFQGKQDEAIGLLRTELKADDKNIAGHFRLAVLLQQQDKLVEAAKHYDAILGIQPQNSLALNNLAWIYHQQNNPQALELADRAFALAPNSAAVVDTLGVILFKQGQVQKAVDHLEKALTLKPGDLNIKYHLAEAYAAQGNKKRATELLELIAQESSEVGSKNKAIELLRQLK